MSVQALESSWRGARANSTVAAYSREENARRDWLLKRGLSSDESSFLLYLAERAQSVGSSTLARIVAAFQIFDGRLEGVASLVAADLIKAKKREETDRRVTPTLLKRDDYLKLVQLSTNAKTEKAERDLLMAILSTKCLLRAEEIANLRWEDVTVEKDHLEVFVPRAKNDQEARGRRTFVKWLEHSDENTLLAKWRVRSAHRSEYVIPNLTSGAKLSTDCISGIARHLLRAIGRENCTHHTFRRSGVNLLVEEGLTPEQIQRVGRWRSAAGLGRYLQDCPEGQGIDLSHKSQPTTSKATPAQLEDMTEDWTHPALFDDFDGLV